MYRIVIVLACLLILIGCRGQKAGSSALSQRYSKFDDIIDAAKPIAFGEDYDVYVFSGSGNWNRLEDFMRSTIEREMFIVYNERYFDLHLAEIKDFDRLTKFRNLVLIGDLSSGDTVSRHIINSLSAKHVERVRQSGGEMYIAKNRWVRDQVVLYLLAENAEKLEKLVIAQANNLFSILLKRLTERIAYHTYLTKTIAADFWEHFPFSLQIPENYRLYSNDKTGRFLSFLYRARQPNREIPDKFVSIYYEPMETDSVDSDWLITKRAELAMKYYDGDVFDAHSIRRERFTLAGYDGWRIIGPWENRNHLVGGGFQSFAFWHEPSKRAYLIDNSVFFPAGDKLPLLLELYMISGTLQIKR